MVSSFARVDSLWTDTNKRDFQSLNDVFSIIHFTKNNEKSTEELNSIINQEEEMYAWLTDSLKLKSNEQQQQFFLLSYHDYLNNKSVTTETHLNIISNFWKPILNCESILTIKAKQLQNEISKGQTIVIQLPLNEYNDAIEYRCPNIDWIYDHTIDLEIKGVIIEKTDESDINTSFFKLKIKKSSDIDATILGRPVQINTIIHIPYNTSWKLIKN